MNIDRSVSHTGIVRDCDPKYVRFATLPVALNYSIDQWPGMIQKLRKQSQRPVTSITDINNEKTLFTNSIKNATIFLG